MFKPLQSLFSSTPPQAGPADAKYFIQEWLQGELKTDGVLIEGVQGGAVHVRVKTPTLKQEVLLLQYDLEQALKRDLKFTLKNLKVNIG
jgi:hypothetical protein